MGGDGGKGGKGHSINLFVEVLQYVVDLKLAPPI